MKGLKKYRSISDYETYTVKEIAKKLNINIRSVYKYYAKGMKPIESSKPLLFAGTTVKEFIKGRLKQRKLQTKLKDNEFFCCKCKKAVTAKDVIIEKTGKKLGNYELLIKKGLCNICNSKVVKLCSSKELKTESEQQPISCESI